MMSTHFDSSPSLSGSSVFPSDGESDHEQDFMDQDVEPSTSVSNGKDKPSTVQKPAQNPPLKYHTAVFPNMEIPIRMKVRGSKTRTDQRGLVNGPDTLVPTMMVQCPFPGGTVVTETTDPVQNISWGPITRVEASQEARDLAKQWRKINQTNESSSEEAPKVVKKPKQPSVPRHESPSAVSQVTSVNQPQGPAQDAGSDEPPSMSTYFPDTETHDDDDEESKTRRRSVKPPPPTPPSAILYDSLSMPTLPILHNTSDPDLVETYRLQRAKGPSAFDKETRGIKRSLVRAKVDRGGDAHLLNNEYTVELASREVAAIAEKWANGRIAATRTRSSTIEESSRDMAELVSIMGGKTVSLNKHETSLTNGGVSSTGVENGTTSEAGDTLAQALNSDNTGGADSSQRSKKKSGSQVLQESRRKIKSRLLSFDLPSHVSKITTHGNIRHQHFVKREVGDHGEKRTVTTWIRIEEVYEVPAPEALKWEDVLHATKPENGKELLDKAKNKLRKRAKVGRTTSRGRHMTVTSSKKRAGIDDDSIDDCESISGGSGVGSAIRETNPVSQTASLLHSLGTSPQVQASSIAKLIKDFEDIIETLTENDNIRVEEEG